MPRAFIDEAAKALSVLALVLLSLSGPHQSLSPVDAQRAVAALHAYAISYCGSAPSDPEPRHNGPCHACRTQVGVLPKPPEEGVPIRFEIRHGFDFGVETRETKKADLLPIGARAPPVLV